MFSVFLIFTVPGDFHLNFVKGSVQITRKYLIIYDPNQQGLLLLLLSVFGLWAVGWRTERSDQHVQRPRSWTPMHGS